MRDSTGLYPRVRTDAAGSGVVSHAGAVLLVDTIGAAGLGRALSVALEPWRKPAAVHDPAKILLDVAVSLALGGDCLADIAVLRGAPEVFGPVASDSDGVAADQLAGRGRGPGAGRNRRSACCGA